MKFFKLVLLINIICFINTNDSHSQSNHINGYNKSLSGEVISYHAPDPRAETALLVRSQDSTRNISWESELSPDMISHDSISFVWLYGMDASPDQHDFYLSFQGDNYIRFTNPVHADREDRIFYGLHGSTLRFRTTLIDRHKDEMGYAIFTIPISHVDNGQPAVFSVNGTTSGSLIWYMTFELPVKENIDISNQDLVIKRGNTNLQAVLLEMVHLGNPSEISIGNGKGDRQEFELETGYNSIRYFVPEVKEKEKVTFTVEMPGQEIRRINWELEPVKKWTIYLVQHTHTDIGYTRPQSEILPEHLRFIDFALDYCDQTDNFPDDAKFRWTCESSWAVEEYIKRRPESRISDLKRRVGEGRIEITAMPFNMSEIADESALRMMLKPVSMFSENGIEVSTAMQNDVNGIGWCLADYFPDIGIKYLVMGEHGHRALIPFDIPTAFWWSSPSGKKMLAFRAEHYMFGNFLLLHTGDTDSFRNNLLNYLDKLESKNYPFNRISLQYSGFVTDNSPPSIISSHLIREWNELYEWPKLRSATSSEFMKFIESEHSEELPVYQKAWPDWWTDGFGSAARETSAVREAQHEMTITGSLLSMAGAMGIDLRPDLHQTIRDIYKNILFYDEHTFGAAESITEPLVKNSMDQWAEKSSFVWEALKDARILREEAFGLIQEKLPRYDVPSIAVFNTLSWPRSGPVEIYIDHEIIPPGERFSILDENGKAIPVQPGESRSDGTTWILWADEIPSFGYRTFKIITGEGQVSALEPTEFIGQYEDKYWKVELSPEDGSFLSMVNKSRMKDWQDNSSQWNPGQLIYERLSNRHQLELFRLEEEPQRKTIKNIHFNSLKTGDVWNSISFTGSLEGATEAPVYVEYRFFRNEPLIELSYSLVKKAVTDPEALYVAFPFDTEQGEILFEAQGGLVQPGKDQLAGTASDWNTVQKFVSVKDNDSQIIISSPDIPLFHLGGLNLGNFSYRHQLESAHVYSWVMNNYWTTNFRAFQEGELKWKYRLKISGKRTSDIATRFGWETSIPLVARVLTQAKGKSDNYPIQNSLISEIHPDLLLVGMFPAEKRNGIILHLREVSGKKIDFTLSQLILEGRKNVNFREVNAIGQSLKNQKEKIVFEPYSTHFILLSWEQ